MDLTMLNVLSSQNIQMDKLDVVFSLRIPEILDIGIAKMDTATKDAMAMAIRQVMAFYVHMDEFNPERQLNSSFHK